jgi:PAS domain S-box-containing protein
VTITNRALLERLHRRRDQVIGRKLREIWDEDIVHDIDLQSAATLSTGRAHADSERAYVAADGSVRWFTLSHLPLRDGNTVVGLVGTCREVTARKVLEQEILEISNREQRRLGTDLHDGLGQELTGLSLLLKVVEGQLAREAPQFKADVTRLNDLLAQAISSTRSLARGLAPVDLDHGGLAEALGHLVSRCKHLYHIECAYLETGSKLPPLSEGAATHLYRVAQEALSNAARYANAKRITVELRVSARKLHLSIADDGIGLAAGLARGQPGLGLKIMEYRARTLGGSIEFDQSSPGTRVALSCSLNLLRQSRSKTAGAA